jgi:hypothetical protein
MKTLVLLQMLLLLLACAADELTPAAAGSGAGERASNPAHVHDLSR